MTCPRCASDHLSIRKLYLIERAIVFLTGLRRYRCRVCDYGFRAPDRRRTPRENQGTYKPRPVA